MGEEGEDTIRKSGEEEEVKEGIASIALLPCGSISGHFIQLPHSICYGLHGTELPCETECSRGEDYRLIKLTIIDYNNKKEQTVVVECKGHDAARFQEIDHAHGWEKDIAGLIEENVGKKSVCVSFECETLKAEKAAEEHIRLFMPKLTGLDVVVNIGPMRISGLDFEAEGSKQLQTDQEPSHTNLNQLQTDLHPNQTDQDPLQTIPNSIRTDQDPLQADQDFFKTGEQSSQTDRDPVKEGQHPIQTDKNPILTDQEPF